MELTEITKAAAGTAEEDSSRYSLVSPYYVGAKHTVYAYAYVYVYVYVYASVFVYVDVSVHVYV